MKKIPRHALLVFFVVCLLGAYSASLSKKASQTISFIPSDVTDYFYSFLNTLQDHPEDAVTYCHFETDGEKVAYSLSNVHVLSYELLGVEKINDDLYAFTIHLEKEFDTHPRRYYFVGKIDGNLRLMVNAGNIPEELKEGFDEKRFTLTWRDFNGDALINASSVIR